MTQSEYARHRRRKRDDPTGGYLVCPGSFFPCRNGVAIEGSFIHVVEIKKRNAYHAMCDKCGIQFTLNGHLWRDFQVLPIYCGSEAPIPGVSLSAKESRILMPYLTEAKIGAIERWKKEIWLDLESMGLAPQPSMEEESNV